MTELPLLQVYLFPLIESVIIFLIRTYISTCEYSKVFEKSEFIQKLWFTKANKKMSTIYVQVNDGSDLQQYTVCMPVMVSFSSREFVELICSQK